jgi:hypothetical protein
MTLTAFFISALSNPQDSLADQTPADCPCGILGTTDEIYSSTGQRKWGLNATRRPACWGLVQDGENQVGGCAISVRYSSAHIKATNPNTTH